MRAVAPRPPAAPPRVRQQRTAAPGAARPRAGSARTAAPPYAGYDLRTVCGWSHQAPVSPSVRQLCDTYVR
ncbi:hypothetical protein [Streptomyces sp. NPDC002328]|uniref:hypothetical protein n=1 Tax=Streptomyces sp. NPDC002328 TaxID=3364642 RepID=UPI0036A59B4F